MKLLLLSFGKESFSLKKVGVVVVIVAKEEEEDEDEWEIKEDMELGRNEGEEETFAAMGNDIDVLSSAFLLF
mgnify:CR=1 FL=1